MSKPELLLLDEPSLGIAPILVKAILANKKDDVQGGHALLSGWFKNDQDNQSDKSAARVRSSLNWAQQLTDAHPLFVQSNRLCQLCKQFYEGV